MALTINYTFGVAVDLLLGQSTLDVNSFDVTIKVNLELPDDTATGVLVFPIRLHCRHSGLA